MKNNLWGTESFDSKPIHVVLFCSRNKDNQHIDGFKERRKSFITHKNPFELAPDFESFVAEGQVGEVCRLYYSVNARDPRKIYQKLLHFLIDEPDFNLCSIMPKIAGIAAQKECAAEKQWMFDFDLDDVKQVFNFVEDIKAIDPEISPAINKTPHGYAVVTEHGFDTRELLEKWKEYVSLKRDDLLCVNWLTKK